MALLAPAGADLYAFRDHLVRRLRRAGSGIDVDGRVIVVPMSVLSELPEPHHPGLPRLTNTVVFRNLTGDELVQVFDGARRAKGLRVAGQARAAVSDYLHHVAGVDAFGNSRGVRSLSAQMLAGWLRRTGGDLSRSMTLADLPDRADQPRQNGRGDRLGGTAR